MQPKNNNNFEIIKAMTVVFILIVLIVFFVFYKTTQTDTILKTEDKKEKDAYALGYRSSLLKTYTETLQKIKNDADFVEKKTSVDKSLVKILEEKTKFPEFDFAPVSLSADFDKNKYVKDFSLAFGMATSSGMGSELNYFVAQISPESDEILELSQGDKDIIKNIATQYEIFAKKIQNLDTPISYKNTSEITVKSALEIAYTLRNLINEKDKLIYSVWFGKYAEVSKFLYK